MAKVGLGTSFTPIAEGPCVFKITEVDDSKYDKFGKLEISMVTADGKKHVERFNILDDKGEVNEKARTAFTFFAQAALNNPSLDEIDTDDLVGCYIKATVKHEVKPSTKDPAKNLIFIRLEDKAAASGFEGLPDTGDTASSVAAPSLDALLGG